MVRFPGGLADSGPVGLKLSPTSPLLLYLLRQIYPINSARWTSIDPICVVTRSLSAPSNPLCVNRTPESPAAIIPMAQQTQLCKTFSSAQFAICAAILLARIGACGGDAAAHAAGDTSQEACSASEYCSLRAAPSQFIGPVGNNLELKSAVSALAYKNEIIIVLEFRVDPAAQFLASYQAAGYGHVMVLTDSEHLCRSLETVFSQLGCGWYPTPVFPQDPELSSMFSNTGLGQKLYLKLWFAARIIRMGYNILMADSGK